MSEAVTDVIAARAHDPQGLSRTLAWSGLLHAVVVAIALLAPRPGTSEPPKVLMTISLGGAPGPKTGGLTQMGGRAVQAHAPPAPTRRQEPAPAPVAPKMTIPQPTAAAARPRPMPPVRTAPQEATGRTAVTGETPRAGSERVETNARGQGFGLSSGGGGAGGVQLDVGNFCCPEYLEQMVMLIQRNWNQNQGVTGSAIVKFTILRDGTITAAQVERTSGFATLDTAAYRALLLTDRLPQLPSAFSNPTLTVHMRFEYQR